MSLGRRGGGKEIGGWLFASEWNVSLEVRQMGEEAVADGCYRRFVPNKQETTNDDVRRSNLQSENKRDNKLKLV